MAAGTVIHGISGEAVCKIDNPHGGSRPPSEAGAKAPPPETPKGMLLRGKVLSCEDTHAYRENRPPTPAQA